MPISRLHLSRILYSIKYYWLLFPLSNILHWLPWPLLFKSSIYQLYIISSVYKYSPCPHSLSWSYGFLFSFWYATLYILYRGNPFICIVLIPKTIFLSFPSFLHFSSSHLLFSTVVIAYLWFLEVIFYILFSAYVEILYHLKCYINLLRANLYSCSNPLWTYCSVWV